jgi:DNA-binding XRE family transcriptional regulator
LVHNHLREVRENRLISVAELARKAGISPLTINRIEKGAPCRLETMRKILDALGLKPLEKDKIFPENGPVEKKAAIPGSIE